MAQAGLRYNSNDIFDIVKTLDADVNKLEQKYHHELPRSPDILFTLTNSHTITNPSFHPCVKFVLPSRRRAPHKPSTQIKSFAQPRVLSFVPPDGRFTLMEYRFDPSANKPGARPALTAAAAAQVHVQVPFVVRHTPHHRPRRCVLPPLPSPSTPTNHYPGAFELTFTSRAGTLENVAVKLYLGSGETGATSTGATGGGE
ncbi:hypothetical protein V8E53_002192 [Lactarius tabidus]